MRYIVPFLGVLVACDSPSPLLGQAEPMRLQRGGYDITVWRAGDDVEAIRHGMARRADKPQLRAVLMQAMQDATGCDLRENSVEGDIGVLRARLSCDE